MNYLTQVRALGTGLLFAVGLLHMIPVLSITMTELTGGRPWIQMILGLAAVIVALVLFSEEL